MNQPSFRATPEQNQKLTQLCQERAASELAHLETTLAQLQRVRAALGSGAAENLTAALRDAKAASANLKDLEQERKSFRDQAGPLLAIAPEHVTLGKAIDCLLLPKVDALRQLQSRLRRLAGEVDRTNQADALITWWRLDFIQQVFAKLPGAISSGRYGRDGKVQTRMCGTLWQGNG